VPPHLDKVAELLGGPCLGISPHISTTTTTCPLTHPLLAAAVVMVVVVMLAFVPLRIGILTAPAVPLPLAAACKLCEGLNAHCPSSRSDWGFFFQGGKLRCCCCSLHIQTAHQGVNTMHEGDVLEPGKTCNREKGERCNQAHVEGPV
jgi:hypothetical protein